MINVDRIYQRVLTLANKEQRGYITPQEFNIFANQAQMDIFEQYFYDLNQFLRTPGNNTVHADMVDILEEKISVFESSSTLTINGSVGSLAALGDFYRLSSILDGNIFFESVGKKEARMFQLSPLTMPNRERPVYVLDQANHVVKLIGRTLSAVTVDYIRIPLKANWTYVVVGEKALYNASNTINFQLHDSEETELVYKILTLAGIIIKKVDVLQAGQGMDSSKIQQEKQ